MTVNDKYDLYSIKHYAKLLFICTLAVFSNLSANDEPVYELPPFQVDASSDRGYVATNTVSGTSLRTSIRDLPMPLEVLNQEFIEDIGAIDMKEALDYSAGVYTSTFRTETGSVSGVAGTEDTSAPPDRSPSSVGSVNNPFANTISIRGYSVPNQQRMGFRVGAGAIGTGWSIVTGGLTDASNLERMEVVRGPAALLYGINVLSGVVNMIPKRPVGEEKFNTTLTLGSYEFYRGTIEATGPLIKDRLNYRAMATFQENNHWTDWQSDKLEYYVSQLEWFITRNRNATLFFEVQYADQTRNGIGLQFFPDDPASGNSSPYDFRDEYNQIFRWGANFTRENAENPATQRIDARPAPFNQYWENYELQDEQTFRISGPDTYYNRKEFNALLNLTLQPVSNLHLDIGAYYTSVKEYTKDVTLATISERSGLFVLANDHENPEFNLADVIRDPDDIEQIIYHGHGIGEVFRTYDRRQDSLNPDFVETYKIPYYYWRQEPKSVDTLQLRARGTYRLETSWFDGAIPATHQFMAGFSYIKDEIRAITGSDPAAGGRGANINYLYTPESKTDDGQIIARGRLNEDPVIFRPSIFDMSVIRYNGEPIPFPGRARPMNTGRVGPNAAQFTNLEFSGLIDAEVWNKGANFVYHGSYWQDKLTIIGGIRNDRYQVRDSEQIRLVDRKIGVGDGPYTENYWGIARTQWAPSLPYIVGDGSKPLTMAELPASVQAHPELANSILSQWELFRESNPNGTVRDSFESYQSFTTKTAGLSWRITDPISVYALYSEGVFPNQGLRDGLHRPIDAEQTRSYELGFKFDLFGGKLSGTISFFRIDRKNAIFSFNSAPHPAEYYGGPLGPSPTSVSENAFDQITARGGEGPLFAKSTDRPFRKVSYPVYDQFIREAFEAFGEEFPTNLRELRDMQQRWGVETLEAVNLSLFSPFGAVGQRPQFYVFDLADVTDENTPHEIDPETGMQSLENGNPFLYALDLAIRAGENFEGFPIYYSLGSSDYHFKNNPSAGGGAGGMSSLVTYQDQGNGIDGQIHFAPIPNWQFMFGFSYQERKVVGRGFNLSPLLDPSTGDPNDPDTWSPVAEGTHWREFMKYDRWVYILGIDNFEDPTDPSTFNGTGVNGLDLSFVPKLNFTLWNKYSFREGPLEGLEIGGGLRYQGPAPTAAPIGGANFTANKYLPPDTPARYELDAMLSYSLTFWDIRWRFSLNVRNLLDDRMDEATVTYLIEETGEERSLRTRQFYRPRTFTLRVSATF